MARIDSTIDPSAEAPEVVNATRARQGSRGKHVLWVLIISTTLAAVALLASLAFHKDEIDGQGGQQAASPAAAENFNTVEGANQTAPSVAPAP